MSYPSPLAQLPQAATERRPIFPDCWRSMLAVAVWAGVLAIVAIDLIRENESISLTDAVGLTAIGLAGLLMIDDGLQFMTQCFTSEGLTTIGVFGRRSIRWVDLTSWSGVRGRLFRWTLIPDSIRLRAGLLRIDVAPKRYLDPDAIYALLEQRCGHLPQRPRLALYSWSTVRKSDS